MSLLDLLGFSPASRMDELNLLMGFWGSVRCIPPLCLASGPALFLQSHDRGSLGTKGLRGLR